MEEWKTFKTANVKSSKTKKTIYQVSNLGNIRAITNYDDSIKIIKQSLSGGHAKSGRYLCLSDNGFKYVHRIVATAFIPNPDNLATVDHINGDKTDNTVENLRWASYRDNNIWAIERRHLLNQ